MFYICIYSCLINMKVLNFKDRLKKYTLKDDTMIESELQRVYIFPIDPRDSKLYSDKRFVSIDDGSEKGTHWTCFIVKDKKSYFFDSFDDQPDKFLLKQLPKPTIYYNYKTQDINSTLCGSYCLYFFYLIEKMKYYDTILKLVFESILFIPV